MGFDLLTSFGIFLAGFLVAMALVASWFGAWNNGYKAGMQENDHGLPVAMPFKRRRRQEANNEG